MWERGILQIQAGDKGAFDGEKSDERHRFPTLCNACYLFLTFSSQLFCSELLTLAYCDRNWNGLYGAGWAVGIETCDTYSDM